jgi:hypothetical protein
MPGTYRLSAIACNAAMHSSQINQTPEQAAAIIATPLVRAEMGKKN